MGSLKILHPNIPADQGGKFHFKKPVPNLLQVIQRESDPNRSPLGSPPTEKKRVRRHSNSLMATSRKPGSPIFPDDKENIIREEHRRPILKKTLQDHDALRILVSHVAAMIVKSTLMLKFLCSTLVKQTLAMSLWTQNTKIGLVFSLAMLWGDYQHKHNFTNHHQHSLIALPQHRHCHHHVHQHHLLAHRHTKFYLVVTATIHFWAKMLTFPSHKTVGISQRWNLSCSWDLSTIHQTLS